MNRVALLGVIASPIRVQDFGSGDTARTKATFVCAVHRRRPPAPPEWIRVETWGPQAQNLVRFNAKGSKVAIDGHLRGSFWNPDGSERGGQLRLAVVADAITYLSPPRAPGGEPAATPPAASAADPAVPPRVRR